MARGALGNDLYTGRRSFPFIRKRKVWFAIALALIALSILTLATRGLNRGIEFTGAVPVSLRVPEADARQLED